LIITDIAKGKRDHRSLRDRSVLPTALLWRGVNYVCGDLVNGERLLKRAADGKARLPASAFRSSDARNQKTEAIADLASAFKALDTSLPSDAPSLARHLGDERAQERADKIDLYLAGKPHACRRHRLQPDPHGRAGAGAVDQQEDRLNSNDAYSSLMWSPYGRELRTLPECPASRADCYAEVWTNTARRDCSRGGAARIHVPRAR